MLGIKNFKWLIMFITALFVMSALIYPVAYAGGLKFGIISVVKDKIEELKEKKREKIAKEIARIRHFEAETNTQGTASFTLPDGKNISCYVYDEEIENLPISGVKVYLITDGEGSKGAYFIVDPQGEYCPQIVNALEYGERQSISRSEAEYQAQFIGLGKKIWLTFKKGSLGGNAPDPLQADIIDQDLLDYILGNLLVYMYSCTLYDLMPYSSYTDFLKSQLREHGAEFLVTTLVLPVGLPVAIASAVVDLAIFGQDAYWYKYYGDRGYTDQDWFDIYQKINMGNIGMYVVYPRKSIPPSESKGAVGGKIIDSSGNPIKCVFVQLIPPPGIAKTGLTGLFYFEDVSAGTYKVRAFGEGYRENWVDDVNPGDINLVIILSPANQIPVISSLSVPSSVSVNSSSLVTCTASDLDGDPLTYTWNCNGGSISGSGYQVTWNAPGSEGTYQVQVIVSDPDERKAIKTVDIYISASDGAGLEIIASYDCPGSIIGGITFDGSNLWSCDIGTEKIYKHNMDAILSVASTYNAPGSEPDGLAWDGTNLWSCDPVENRIYRHNMDSSLSVQNSFGAPGSSVEGLTWDGSNLWSCDHYTKKIYKHKSIFSSVGALSYNSPGPSPQDLAWDGTNIWSCDQETGKIYKHKLDYKLSVEISYDAPGKHPEGLTWDGTYLWCCDPDMDKIYKLRVP